MISYEKFKKKYDAYVPGAKAEFEIYFKNKETSYMIIKYDDCCTFQRCGNNQSGEIRFESLDELVNTKTIDDIVLIEEWDNIEDILWNACASIIDEDD